MHSGHIKVQVNYCLSFFYFILRYIFPGSTNGLKLGQRETCKEQRKATEKLAKQHTIGSATCGSVQTAHLLLRTLLGTAAAKVKNLYCVQLLIKKINKGSRTRIQQLKCTMRLCGTMKFDKLNKVENVANTLHHLLISAGISRLHYSSSSFCVYTLFKEAHTHTHTTAQAFVFFPSISHF